MHLKKQKKSFINQYCDVYRLFLGYWRYVQYMYILNQIDKLIMYTFESYYFLSGQTNKEKLPYVVYERSLTTPYW